MIAWSPGNYTEGEFYFKLGKFDSAAACKRTINKVPHLTLGDTYAMLYAPLEKTPFNPQKILIVANPRTMLKLAQSVLFRLGGRIYAEFSGIQTVYSDATAQTYLTGARTSHSVMTGQENIPEFPMTRW